MGERHEARVVGNDRGRHQAPEWNGEQRGDGAGDDAKCPQAGTRAAPVEPNAEPDKERRQCEEKLALEQTPRVTRGEDAHLDRRNHREREREGDGGRHSALRGARECEQHDRAKGNHTAHEQELACVFEHEVDNAADGVSPPAP